MKKGNFNPARAENVVLPFANQEQLYNTFRNVFAEYPPSQLQRLSGAKLYQALTEIAQRPDVAKFQDTISEELKDGKEGLEFIAKTIIRNQLPLPKESRKAGNNSKVYKKEYREVEAWCNDSKCERNDRVGIGLIDARTSLEEMIFMPDNLIYPNKLLGLFPNQKGVLTCDNCGGTDLRCEPVALTYVYRVSITKNERESKVRAVVQSVADKLLTEVKSSKLRYQSIEQKLIDGLYFVFKSIKDNGNSINYDRVYRLFEWVRRGNIDLAQLQWIDERTRVALQKEISRVIPLPYAVIRTRIKRLERFTDKAIQAFYKSGRNKQGRARTVRDVYGIRVMLPTGDDCYTLFRSLKRLKDISIVPDSIDNYMEHPNKRGESEYRALHFKMTDGVRTYSVQIRTHEMDRLAETHPDLKHDKYVQDEKDSIKKVPFPFKAVIATIIGVRPSTYR